MSDDLEMQQRRLKAKNALDDLSGMRGMGTELVTLIIPPDKAIHDVRQQLAQEIGQASNIKSKQTKKHVSDAIESAASAINNMRETPQHGIAIFTGHVIVGNNKTRMTTIVLDDPPEPFRSFRYRCDSTFEVTQLEDMLIDKTCYGIFVIDRGEAAYGLASGKSVHCQEEMQSNIMGKHRQGGQSAQRFERLIEEHAHKFFKRAAEHASDYWLGMIENMEGIIIGGPGATKDQVLKGEFFHHEIAKIVRKPTFDVGYSNESGLRELVQRAGGLMHEIELDAERQLVDQFLAEIMKQHPKATYGEMMIRSALEQGAVDTLLLSEGLRKVRQAYTCRQCQHGWQITTDRLVEIPNCPSCNAASDQVREDPDNTISLMDELTTLAGHSSSKVKLISMDTEEGATLMEAFAGLGALLRYPWS
ncbi:MAG: peptide chain release factor 1 [Euryarchaeota archaeon]|nr:peptide chain release factor 1 [Euryarchaeota archaeon]DAC61854.1 MAG TPA: peptide chain release factor 1 [Candidatus Poseidoniales archaeon]HIH81834.1 peptide chain release factor 1 [Candidatus Thalassarchaeaceae archaeon]|tara:strand:+ start:11185 stop:12438 length:1254 start_codon:yes stop_codon:yes gene_type:complete